MQHGFGIIGAGAIADIHARSIIELTGNGLIGVFNINAGKAREFALKHNCRAYNTPDELISDKRIDIICVCTPSGLHLEPSLGAVKHGKHCIIEKPLEITPERCDMIIEAAAKNGVLVAGIFNSRFLDVSREVKMAVDDKRFGKLVHGDAFIKWFRSQDYYDMVPWRGSLIAAGGGALMNQGIHSVDLLQWYMGPVRSVQAFTSVIGHNNIEVEDTAVAAIEFENGALGVIEGSTAVYPGSFKRIEILGTAGSAIIEENRLAAWKFLNETKQDDMIRSEYLGASVSGGGVSNPMAIDYQGHKCQIEDMILAIDNNRNPAVDGVEARKAVEIICAVYESARTGKKVTL